jgi:thiazole synthase
MKIRVNGEELDCDEAATIFALLQNIDADPGRVAVMVNSEVVPRAQQTVRTLAEGDAIEVVTFVGGGTNEDSSDCLQLGGQGFKSRLILGTGKFASVDQMVASVRAAGVQLVTVALKRFNPSFPDDDLMAPLAELDDVALVPNTSGALNAQEAIRAAQLGRELSGSPLVKVEIHPNPHHLLPDPVETLKASEKLVKEGFVVLPYIPADPVLAKRLEDAGCAAVMPLGSAIGSGRGLATADMLRVMVRDSNVPVIVDAGLRSPSEATQAMEMGADGVLVNSAVATAGDPPRMAEAFARAVETGYAARRAGLMPMGTDAVATSPLTSFLSDG